jgi:hypothetical protein
MMIVHGSLQNPDLATCRLDSLRSLETTIRFIAHFTGATRR